MISKTIGYNGVLTNFQTHPCHLVFWVQLQVFKKKTGDFLRYLRNSAKDPNGPGRIWTAGEAENEFRKKRMAAGGVLTVKSSCRIWDSCSNCTIVQFYNVLIYSIYDNSSKLFLFRICRASVRIFPPVGSLTLQVVSWFRLHCWRICRSYVKAFQDSRRNTPNLVSNELHPARIDGDF